MRKFNTLLKCLGLCSLFIIATPVALADSTTATQTSRQIALDANAKTLSNFDKITIDSYAPSLSVSIDNAGKKTINLETIGEKDYGGGIFRSLFGDYSEVLCVNMGDNGEGQVCGTSGTGGQQIFSDIFLPQPDISRMFAKALNITTTLALAFAAFLMFIGFLFGVLHYPSQDRSLTETFSNVKTVTRWVSGGIVMFPTSTGFNIGNLGMIKMLAYSSAAGNLVWVSALTVLDDTTLYKRVENVVKTKLSNNLDAKSLMKNLFVSSYCVNQMNHKSSVLSRNLDYAFGSRMIIQNDRITVNFGPVPLTSNDDAEDSGLRGILNVTDDGKVKATEGDAPWYKVWDSSTPYSRYVTAIFNSEKPETYCGAITIPFNYLTQAELNAAEGHFLDEKNTRLRQAVITNTYAYAQVYAALAAMQKAYKWQNENMVMDDESDRAYLFANEKGDATGSSYLSFLNILNDMESTYYDYLKSFTAKVEEVGEGRDSWLTTLSDAVKERFFFVNNAAKRIFIYDTGFIKDVGQNTEPFINNINQFAGEYKKVPEYQYYKALAEISSDASKGLLTDDNAKKIIEEKTQKILEIIQNNQKERDLLYRITNDAITKGWISAGAYFTSIMGISTGFDLIDTVNINYQIPKFYENVMISSDKDKSIRENESNTEEINSTRVARLLNALNPSGLLEQNAATASSAKLRRAYFSTEHENSAGLSFMTGLIGYNPQKTSTSVYVHPMLQLKQQGDNFLLVGQSLLALNMATNTLGNYMSMSSAQKNDAQAQMDRNTQITNAIGQNKNASALGKIASSMLMQFGNVLNVVAWILIIAGVVLSIYLQLLPTIYWIYGIMAWILSALINMIAIPIVALGVVMAKGEEFLGRAQAGAMMMLETIIRPSLAIVGLLATGLLSAIFVDLAITLLDLAYSLSNPSSTPIAVIGYTAIRVFVEYHILVYCCSLIIIVPQRVITHIQGTTTVDDQSENYSNKLLGAISQGRAELSTALRR